MQRTRGNLRPRESTARTRVCPVPPLTLVDPSACVIANPARWVDGPCFYLRPRIAEPGGPRLFEQSSAAITHLQSFPSRGSATFKTKQPIVGCSCAPAELEYHPLTGVCYLQNKTAHCGLFVRPRQNSNTTPSRGSVTFKTKQPIVGCSCAPGRTRIPPPHGGLLPSKQNSPLWAVRVPPAELESATFCSASRRSIQLSYEGRQPKLYRDHPNRQGGLNPRPASVRPPPAKESVPPQATAPSAPLPLPVVQSSTFVSSHPTQSANWS